MSTTVSPRDVFGTATLLLHFEALTSPPGYTLTAEPSVRAGVELSPDEVESSVLRGGDGRAADFAGGVVTVSPKGSQDAAASQRGLSLFIRVQDPSGAWGAPLLTGLDTEGKPRFALYAADQSLVFELFTDFREQPLTMSIDLPRIGALDWHDIAMRYSGPHAELFLDGALVDEEWPIGALAGKGRMTLRIGGSGFQSATGRFAGLVDHVAMWDRPLADNEIHALSGGPSRAAAGLPAPAARPIQYGAAPGGGNVGDCFPFFHDGVFHFYYLLDRRHHASKYGLGAHQWAHSSSRDLVHWEHHPLAVPITEEREGSICTGSMFFHEGTWYAFYATRLADRSEHLGLAIGRDGVRFQKVEPNPFASPRPPYKHGPFRDPHVFRGPADGLFHMLVTAELENPPIAGRGGCLAHLASTDLRHWQQREPFLVTGYGDQPECSEIFKWGEWYYLAFSHFGVAHYRMARDPFGPWTRPRVDSLDGPLARVMKTAPFTGNRRMGAFFLAEGGYAGRAVFRELVQHTDGTLGSTWPEEMIPPAGPVLSPGFEALGSGISGNAGSIRIDAPEGFAAAALTGVPRRFLASFRVKAANRVSAFGVSVRGTGNFREGLQLEFEPPRRRVGWRHPGRPSWQEEETAALYEVAGLDGTFSVRLIVLDEVLDVCIDKRRTLINRADLGGGDRLFFYCHEGSVEFGEIQVRPLADLS